MQYYAHIVAYMHQNCIPRACMIAHFVKLHGQSTSCYVVRMVEQKFIIARAPLDSTATPRSYQSSFAYTYEVLQFYGEKAAAFCSRALVILAHGATA